MSEQLSSTSVEVRAAPQPSVKLWTPMLIAPVTFFLGFPAGLVLASVNWLRMGLARKAVTHLVAGLIGTVVLIVSLMLLPSESGRLLVLPVNIAVLVYLRNQMAKDIEVFRAGDYAVQNAHWLGGCLIGVVALAFYLALAFVVGLFLGVVLSLIGVPIPG